MRLACLRLHGAETLCFDLGTDYVPLADVAGGLRRPWKCGLLELLTSGEWDTLCSWYRDGGREIVASPRWLRIPREKAASAPILRRPRKIWGIGLNYRDHAADLSEKSPTAEPASFMKPDTALIGPEDEILLPRLSDRTTGEGELGLVFARQCRDVAEHEWQSVLAGYTTIVDMTAEDILRRNPRNLTQAKSFDTFFSLGSVLVTPDEIPDIKAVRVTTRHNGQAHATNVVSNMTFPPDHLVTYHSRIMTMLPGDIISSGTPGAAVLADGDRIEAEVEGIGSHGNPVRDLKR